MGDFVVISKAAIEALADPVTAMDLSRSSVDFDLELADQDPSAAVVAVKDALRDRPIGDICAYCGTQLTVTVEGHRYRFNKHTDDFCKMAARQRYSTVVSQMRREVLDNERVRRALGELLKQERESEEVYGRASMALDRAGVPNDVGNKDPLDQLAARIRWLAARSR